MSRRTPRKALPPRTAAWLRDQLALLDRGRADGDDGTAEERYGLRKGAEFAAKLEREMLARRLETLRVLAQLAAACDVPSESRIQLERRIRGIVAPHAAAAMLSAITENRAPAGRPEPRIDTERR